MRKLVCLSLYIFSNTLYSQYYNPIQTVVPFITLSANAVQGSMGDIGVVANPSYHEMGLLENPALLSGGGKSIGFFGGWKPLNRNIVPGINIYETGGYFSINKNNAIGIQFNYLFYKLDYLMFNEYVEPYSINELSPKITYSHSWDNGLSMGLAFKYIRSNYGRAFVNTVNEVHPANSLAADYGVCYRKTINPSSPFSFHYSIGASVTNIGPKMTYSNDISAQFIPTTLSVGGLVNPRFSVGADSYLGFTASYQISKLLVPTPPISDSTGIDLLHGEDPNITVGQALYKSFYDAPGGFKEEMREIIHKVGLEGRFTLKNTFYVAGRMGCFLENKYKGNRKFNTLGFGIGFFGFHVDGMYIIPFEGRNSPLCNTFCISAGATINLDGKWYAFQRE